MVAEDVRTHTQRLHSAILRTRRELTVGHGVAVIPARITLKNRFDCVDERLGRLITVAVTMHRETCPVIVLDDVSNLIWGREPNAIARMALGRVVVIRPRDTGGKPLDRSVEKQLHDAEPQAVRLGVLEVGASSGEIRKHCRAVLRNRRDHHHADREALGVNRGSPGRNIVLVKRATGQVDHRCMTGIAGFVTKVQDAFGGQPGIHKVLTRLDT